MTASVFYGLWRGTTCGVGRQIQLISCVVFNSPGGSSAIGSRFVHVTRGMPGDGSSEAVPAKVPKIVTETTKEEKAILRFSKLTENAITPTRGSSGAAGYDLYSAYDCIVPAQGKTIALTDLQIALPDGCYGRVAPRSGLAAKHFIDVGAGVVDQDYRGNVGVVLFNFGRSDFEVKKGDRIAQLILERIFIPDLLEVPTLDCTVRGSDGFGSTG